MTLSEHRRGMKKKEQKPHIQDSDSTPEEFGLEYHSTSIEKRRLWDRQEVFLAAFRETGRIFKAAEATGLTRWAHNHWVSGDVFGYRERLKNAHADWAESKVESRIDDRLDAPEGNRGSDVLLMLQAKAEMPEKYREQVTVVDTSAIRESLDRLRDMGVPRIDAPKVVEGTATVVPGAGQNGLKSLGGFGRRDLCGGVTLRETTPGLA